MNEFTGDSVKVSQGQSAAPPHPQAGLSCHLAPAPKPPSQKMSAWNLLLGIPPGQVPQVCPSAAYFSFQVPRTEHAPLGKGGWTWAGGPLSRLGTKPGKIQGL